MDIKTLNEILTFIESPYQTLEPIAESGQRKVYMAMDAKSECHVVLKICPLNPVMVARIKREIKILGEIDSKYFPKIFFEYFVTEEEIGYFLDSFEPNTAQNRINEITNFGLKPFLITVEEYIEHIPWEKCQDVLKKQEVLVEFLIHLFSGLRLLWGKKIVHRDLKPENILIRTNMEPVIIDLGIAKSMNEGATVITNPAFPSPCTPRFAAPEQLTNNKAEVTYKSDQFSVGVISFLVLTDKFPYGDPQKIGIEGVVNQFPHGIQEGIQQNNCEVAENLTKLIERMLRVYPYQRYRSVEEILHELNELQGAK